MVAHKYSFELKSDLSELDHLCQHLTKFGHVTRLNITKIFDPDQLFAILINKKITAI
jgi:hypothetical protein